MEDRRILSSEEKAEDLEAHVALIAQEFRAGFEAADRIDPVGCQNSVTGCKSVIFRDVDRVWHPTRPRRARAAADLDARRTALRPSVSLTHSPSARRKTSRWPSLNKTKRTISTEEAGASRTAATAMDAARSTGYR